MDMNMLCAETYNEICEGPSQPCPPHVRTRTRKGSKKDNMKAACPDEMARQRGRPRLDTKDQTQAERRRTQIRLAQRAYRQRKETTISGLNSRVASLEQTIQDMHKTLLDFQSKAVAAGLHRWNPALAGTLEISAATCAELAKNGMPESDAEGEDLEATQAGEASADAGLNILDSRDMTPQLAKREVAPGRRRRQPGADAGLGTNSVWGYPPTFQNMIVPSDSHDEQQNPPQEAKDASMQHWDVPNKASSQSNQDFPLSQMQVPEESFVSPPFLRSSDTRSSFQPPSFISSELPLPTTFSNTEKSFARRLIRRAYETAMHLLASPSSTLEELNRFKFTFCYSNRQYISEYLRKMLGRSGDENLEVWEAPFWHEGGSGLHFPRVGIDATSEPPENWADPGSVGPPFHGMPETDLWKGIGKTELLEKLGIEGEWFDSNDVEQYLHAKGIHLDGDSSIVEIEEPDNDPEFGTGTATAPTTAASPSMTHSSSGGSQSPPIDFVPANAALYGNEDLFNPDPLTYHDALPDVDMEQIFAQCSPVQAKTTSDISDFDFHLFPQMSQMQQPVNQPLAQLQAPEQGTYFKLKTKKYVDVEKLIDAIVPQSVCLGRTPGFRRTIIDDALKSATTESLAEMVVA